MTGGAVTHGWQTLANDENTEGTMMSKIDDLLAQEGTAAENYDVPDKLPAHVQVGQPNVGRGTVVSVRLSDDEHGRLQRAAAETNLPVSTLIRLWTLDRLHSEQSDSGGTVTKRLERLEQEVFKRSA